jgi:hypothetical protein
MRRLLLILVLAACAERESGQAIKTVSTATTTISSRSPVESALVYLGPLPTHDTTPPPPVPESQMEDGATYVDGVRMNPGAFDSVARRLKLPRVVPDADCSEDGCGFPWRRVACNELLLRATDSDDAPTVGKIAAGDTFTVKSSHLQITAPAKILFRKNYAITESYDVDGAHGPRPDTVRFAAGDTLYVFEHDDQLTRWWYRGMLGRGLPFGDKGDELSPQQTVTWYEVVRPEAASAWWKSKGSVLTSDPSRCES